MKIRLKNPGVWIVRPLPALPGGVGFRAETTDKVERNPIE